MASRSSFHSRLSSIMETMAKSALSQVCRLVDEDSSKLQLELSRLLVANSALAEKVNNLECELTIVRRDAPKLSKSCRSVGVQTVCCREEDACDVSRPLTIEGIFGKDWCMNLWKGRDPYSLQRCTDSQHAHTPDESIATLSDQISITEVKEEEYLQDDAADSQQEALISEAHEDVMTEEPQQLTMDYAVDASTCSMSFDQEGEQVVSAGGIEDPAVQLISMNDTEQAFSTHIIPIDDEDDVDYDDDDDPDVDDDHDNDDDDNDDNDNDDNDNDDNDDDNDDNNGDDNDEENDDENNDDNIVQLVQISEEELVGKTAQGRRRRKRHTLPLDSENCALEDSLDEFSEFNDAATKYHNSEKFTCYICNRTFFHKGTLTRHMKSHKSNFCSICKQHFHHKNRLSSHKCVPPVPTKRVSKSCELCGKTFANPSALRIHYVVHTGEKPYRCNMCGKRFTQKGNLKCHLRIHTGEKPFRCVKCGKTFTQKVNLNHHLMAHLNREAAGESNNSRRQHKGE